MSSGTESVPSVSDGVLEHAVSPATAQWNSRRPVLLDLSGRTDERKLIRIAGELGRGRVPVCRSSCRADDHRFTWQLSRKSVDWCLTFAMR